jgi:hypothetical protein
VAEELEDLPRSEYPALWDWLGRLNTLKQQLDACRED